MVGWRVFMFKFANAHDQFGQDSRVHANVDFIGIPVPEAWSYSHR